MYHRYYFIVVLLFQTILVSHQEESANSRRKNEGQQYQKPGSIIVHVDKNMRVIDHERILDTAPESDDYNTPGVNIQVSDILAVFDKLDSLGLHATTESPNPSQHDNDEADVESTHPDDGYQQPTQQPTQLPQYNYTQHKSNSETEINNSPKTQKIANVAKDIGIPTSEHTAYRKEMEQEMVNQKTTARSTNGWAIPRMIDQVFSRTRRVHRKSRILISNHVARL